MHIVDSGHYTPPPLVSDVQSPHNDQGTYEDDLIGAEPVEYSLLEEPRVGVMARGPVREPHLGGIHLLHHKVPFGQPVL